MAIFNSSVKLPGYPRVMGANPKIQSSNQTRQWKIHHLWIIFALKIETSISMGSPIAVFDYRMVTEKKSMGCPANHV